ncbi:aminopeptidase N-like [Glandiceps talaboti]
MAKGDSYVDNDGKVYPAEQRNGVFIKYLILCIVVVLVLVLFIVVVLLVYFLHPGWSCPNADDNGLPTAQPQTQKPFEGRLPDTLKPTNYRIKIQPYMDEEDGDKRFLFDGEVDISMKCEKSTNVITLHALKLDIDEDTVRVNEIDTNEDFGVKDISTNEEYEFLIIKTKKKLEADKQYMLSINYVGILNNSDIVALYLNVYQTGNDTRYAVASQLENSYGRRVFPSFDEPAMKATFDIIIKHRTIRSALSNMPVIRNETDGDWNTAYFDRTPVMPNYLVAVVVSDFVYKEKTTQSGVKFRVWSRPEMIDATDFSLDYGVKTLEYFENLWNISYSLPKLDMVALPVLRFGAMENWGLVLYKEKFMLYDKNVHTPVRVQSVAGVVAHEIVHKWFGNLVTMAWWSDTWLNEGFARHFQCVAIDQFLPEWEFYDQFYQDSVTIKAFNDDASSDSHATVRPDVGWEKDLWGQFDTRVYERGSQIIMMMRSFLGDTIVYDAFRSYLRKYSYGNTYSYDLWNALTETAKESGVNIDMKEVMDPWLLQLGFPVVTITRKDDTTAMIEQKMFVLDREDEIPDAPEDLNYIWYIPLTYIHAGESLTPSNGPSLAWLNGTLTGAFNLNGATADDWVLGNIYQHGYYRVNYDLDNWSKLISQLGTDHEKIPIQNRAALIDDVFNLARSGDVDVVLAFEVSDYLGNEEGYSPWKAAISNLEYIRNMLEKTPSYGNLEIYGRELIKPIYGLYGWNFQESDNEDENHVKYHLKVEAIKLSCDFNDEDCVKKATKSYSDWMKNKQNNGIPPDIRALTLCTAIRHGGQDDWDFAYRELKKTTDESLIDDITSGLACTEQVWLLQKYLNDYFQRYINETAVVTEGGDSDFVISISEVDEDIDFYKVIEKVREQSTIGHMVAKEFSIYHFDDLRARDADGSKSFPLIWELADRMNSKSQQMQLEDFARKHNDMPDDQVAMFYKAVRKVKANIRWMERNYNDLEEWLADKTRE